jgi:hypothetical protein
MVNGDTLRGSKIIENSSCGNPALGYGVAMQYATSRGVSVVDPKFRVIKSVGAFRLVYRAVANGYTYTVARGNCIIANGSLAEMEAKLGALAA